MPKKLIVVFVIFLAGLALLFAGLSYREHLPEALSDILPDASVSGPALYFEDSFGNRQQAFAI